MREAVAVQIGGLSDLMKSNAEVCKGTSTDPVVWLDRVAALFRDVDVQTSQITDSHPCVPALSDAWPVLQQALDK